MSRRLQVLSVLLVPAVAAGCASSTGKSTQTTVVRTVTASQTPSDESSSAMPPTSPANTETVAATSFTMPNEVGKVLQDAQDDIQAISGNPLFFTRSTDATGAGRHQILDRDWKICAQNVPAGTSVGADADIVFSVVKLSESC